MEKRLSKKEKDFAKEYAKTGNGTQSVIAAKYDVKDENSAGVIAHQNLRKVKVQKVIKSIAEQIPDDLLVEKHLELLNAQKVTRTMKKGEEIEIEESVDNQAISKGLDMAYKIKGTYAPEKHINEIDATEELRQLADEIIQAKRATS